MAFLTLLLTLMVVSCQAQTCYRNYRDVTFIGDSRMDRARVTPGAWDWAGNNLGYIQAKGGSGLIKQFSPEYMSDKYYAEGKYRQIYLGVNDCTERTPEIPQSLTLDVVFSKVYKAYCNGDPKWRETPVVTDSTTTRFRYGNNLVTGVETVIQDFQFNNPGGLVEVGTGAFTGIYKLCYFATKGTYLGVNLVYNAWQCGFFDMKYSMDGFQGFIYVSPTLDIRGGEAAKCTLFKSYGLNPAGCTGLTRVWNELSAVETPNNGGVYPTGGHDNMHGAPAVRNFFAGAFGCNDVDWSKVDGTSCVRPNCPSLTQNNTVPSELLQRLSEVEKQMAALELLAGSVGGSVNSTHIQSAMEIVKKDMVRMLDTAKNETVGVVGGIVNQGKQEISNQINKAKDDAQFFLIFGYVSFGITLLFVLWKIIKWIIAGVYKAKGQQLPLCLAIL